MRTYVVALMNRIKNVSRTAGIVAGILIAATVTLAPAATRAAGVSYLAGAVTSDVHPTGADLSVLTYPVPGGLLVADRLAPGAKSRYGTPFKRLAADSEFFLVQAKRHPAKIEDLARRLRALGHIHWNRQGAFLVEVAAADRARFARQHIERVRIPLDPPPVGWDRPRRPFRPLPGSSAAKASGLIQDFVDTFSGPAFFQTIQEISGNAYFYFNGLKSVSTRYYNTADKDLVADFLAAKLAGYGYTVTFDDFLSGSTPCRNIVATRTGTVSPDEYVILGAHYDSISENPTTAAPGAEDNGSGTASVMEIARIAAGRQFDRTVQFVLFDSEEQGLYGSYHFVQDATSAGRNIVAAITMDMIAYYDTHYAVRIEGEAPWEWLMADMETQVTDLTDIASQKDYNSWGSDHVPFQQAGIPAFLAIDYDYGGYPGYHRTSDLWSQIAATAQIGTQISRACAGTLAEVAGLQSDLSAVANLPASGAITLTAYPNPFNPRVAFVFDLADGGAGELAVFDVSGRRIAVLARGAFGRGFNQVFWDGTDARGRAVVSGTYFGRLRYGEHTASTAVNLVR